VRELHAHIQGLQRSAQRMPLEVATVTRVQAVGMGDRVCVDLCANMSPGEGMLVGNFCRTLFLIHSEVCCLLPSARLCCELVAHPCASGIAVTCTAQKYGCCLLSHVPQCHADGIYGPSVLHAPKILLSVHCSFVFQYHPWCMAKGFYCVHAVLT
jgi:hypothetical protein